MIVFYLEGVGELSGIKKCTCEAMGHSDLFFSDSLPVVKYFDSFPH